MKSAQPIFPGILYAAFGVGISCTLIWAALGIVTESIIPAASLSLPAVLVGLFAYGRDPSGKWWRAPIVTAAGTAVLILAALFIFVSTY